MCSFTLLKISRNPGCAAAHKDQTPINVHEKAFISFSSLDCVYSQNSTLSILVQRLVYTQAAEQLKCILVKNMVYNSRVKKVK